MRVLVGDQWRDGYLDYHRGPGEIRLEVRAWAALAAVDELYFVPGKSWRRVLDYAREYGPLRVARKIRSRLAESGRNEKYLCAGAGVVIEAEPGEAFQAGDAVAFVAPCHPRCVDRVSLPSSLLRRPIPGLVPSSGSPAGILWLGPERPGESTESSLAGWSPQSGTPILESEVDAILTRAARRFTDPASRPLTLEAGSDLRLHAPGSTAPTGALKAVVVGLGHYAKSNILGNLDSRLRVTEVREIDPLQIGPVTPAPAYGASTDPEVPPDAASDVVFAAGYHHSHADTAISALRRGRWAVVEKPLVTNRDQLARLRDAIRAHPGRLYACFQKRYSPLNPLALRDVGAGGGEAVHYHAIVFEVKLPTRHWYRWPVSGSRIVSNGCHWIDHFLFLNRWSPPVFHDAWESVAGDVVCVAELENGAGFSLVLTDHGSARLGMRDHVELRRGDVTVVIRDSARYVAESTGAVLRRRTLRRFDTHARMYREISTRIAAGVPGDTEDSILRSAGLMLDLEEDLVSFRALRLGQEAS